MNKISKITKGLSKMVDDLMAHSYKRSSDADVYENISADYLTKSKEAKREADKASGIAMKIANLIE